MVIFWQRLEGLIVCAWALALYWHINAELAWWATLLIFFSPDLSFLGYLVSKRFGGHLYNLLHVYALGMTVAALGFLLDNQYTLLVGTLLFAHCGYDRALGYGLKHLSGFHHTHLGTIGKNKGANREA